MTEVKEITSREARRKWREVLDMVMTGSSDVAITRYGQLVAVIIPAQDYEALVDRIDELRITRMAERVYEQYIADRDSAVSYEEVRRELMGENEGG